MLTVSSLLDTNTEIIKTMHSLITLRGSSFKTIMRGSQMKSFKNRKLISPSNSMPRETLSVFKFASNYSLVEILSSYIREAPPKPFMESISLKKTWLLLCSTTSHVAINCFNMLIPLSHPPHFLQPIV
jgi:hypothetical protein